MSRSYSFFAAGALVFLSSISFASAAEDYEIWSETLTTAWLDEHIAAKRVSPNPKRRYGLARTEIWTNGLVKSEKAAFNPNTFDRSLGAKFQPFNDLNLRLGTEVIRSGGDSSLTSRANWEAFWTRQSNAFGGTEFGLSTGGSMATINTGYSQTVSGTLGIPLALPLENWTTQFKLSPNMNLDTASGSVGSGLLSEIMTQTVLSSQADAFRSVLNVKVGYGVAHDARPSASAMLEIRISPKL